MDKHIRITYSVAANVITFDYRIRASAAIATTPSEASG